MKTERFCYDMAASRPQFGFCGRQPRGRFEDCCEPFPLSSAANQSPMIRLVYAGKHVLIIVSLCSGHLNSPLSPVLLSMF